MSTESTVQITFHCAKIDRFEQVHADTVCNLTVSQNRLVSGLKSFVTSSLLKLCQQHIRIIPILVFFCLAKLKLSLFSGRGRMWQLGFPDELKILAGIDRWNVIKLVPNCQRKIVVYCLRCFVV